MIKRSTKRVILGLLVITAIVLLLIFSVGRYFAGQEAKRRYQEEKANLKPRPPAVYVIERETKVRSRDYSADLLPWLEAQVAAEVAGTLTAVNIEYGDIVKKGDVLALVDAEIANLAVQATEARHSENIRLLREVETLSTRNVTSKSEFEASRARMMISEAELAQAKETLARHSIKAPFDGIINDRYVEKGDNVNVGSPIVTMVDLSKLRVVFYVNEFEIPAFAVGQELNLTVNSLPGRTFTPKVRYVTRSADMQTRLFRIEAVLEGGDIDLRGGLQGVISADIAIFKDSLFVPTAAVRLAGDKATVLMEQDGDVGEAAAIEIGPEVDGYYPVFDGLEEGDKIIIR